MTIWGCKTNLVKDDTGDLKTRGCLLKQYPDAVELERGPNKYETYIHNQGYVKDTEQEQQDLVFAEIESLKNDLKSALVWQFRMISTLYELGVTKNIWSGSDISDIELKEKYLQWETKLSRLREIGE